MKRTLRMLTTGFFIQLVSLSLYSQSLYEIKFTDKQKNKYNGFLVFFNEGNAYMRIAYNYNNAYNVVHVSYTLRNGTNSQGTQYSMLTGNNPVYITENKSGLRYNPDYFIWFYNTRAQKWDTPYTTDDSLLNPNNYILVDSYTKLDPKSITDEYLREFFGNDESQYFSLKRMCGLTTETGDETTAKDNNTGTKDNNRNTGDNTTTNTNKNYNSSSTLHLVLIANTLDPTIGMGCSTDEKNLRNEFNEVADALGVSFREHIIDGASFSKENVQAELNSLEPAKNDIVLFIYRGHGFRYKNQTEDWPRMDLRTSSYAAINDNSSMNLAEVYSILKSKGARLNIILGDCCNSEVDASSVTTSNYLTFQVDNNSDVSKLKKLFMNSNGIILSSAAQKGEVSWNTPEGGLYSMSFLQALREEISYLSNDPCNWNNIISKTISLARNKSTATYCSNCTLQDGIKYVSVVGDY
ncbi:MAG: caspase family protein [Chitinophagales bacterium]